MINKLSGEGWVWDGKKNLGQVKYNLQHYIPPGHGVQKIYGTLDSEEINFHLLNMEQKMLTLQMNEKDYIQFLISRMGLPNTVSIDCSGPIFQKENEDG